MSLYADTGFGLVDFALTLTRSKLISYLLVSSVQATIFKSEVIHQDQADHFDSELKPVKAELKMSSSQDEMKDK